MNRLVTRTRLPRLLAVEAAAVLVLHRLGRLAWLRIDAREPLSWLATAPLEDALAAVLRLAALGLAWWLLGSTGLYALGRGARLPGLAATTARVTLPALRRAVDRAVVAGALGSSLLAGPVAWATPPLPPPPDQAVGVTTGDRQEVAGTGTAASDEPAGPGEGQRYEVRPGDNLWTITAGYIGATDPALVAPVWGEVIAVNRDRLRSGNPDLIYPGEVVWLPEEPDAASS